MEVILVKKIRPINRIISPAARIISIDYYFSVWAFCVSDAHFVKYRLMRCDALSRTFFQEVFYKFGMRSELGQYSINNADDFNAVVF